MVTHFAVNPTNPGKIALSYSDSNVHTARFPPMVMTGVITLTGTPSGTFANVTRGVLTRRWAWLGLLFSALFAAHLDHAGERRRRDQPRPGQDFYWL